MAFNGVEDRVGVEALKQHERRAELNAGQKDDDPADVRHGQRLDPDIIVRKSPMPDNQVYRFG